MKRPRLRKWANWALIPLTAGLGVITVAWGVAFKYPNHYGTAWFEKKEGYRTSWLIGTKSNGHGIECWNVWRYKWPEPKPKTPPTPVLPVLTELPTWARPPTDPASSCHSRATGWPFPCLGAYSEMTEATEPTRLSTREKVRFRAEHPTQFRWSGALVWRRPSSEVPFPLTPIWRPLLADWAIFTAALAVPVLCICLLRAIRRRPWCCTHCGYDRTGLAPHAKCPECGTTPAGGRLPS